MRLVISNRIHIPIYVGENDALIDFIQKKFMYDNPVYLAAEKRGYRKIDAPRTISNWDYTMIDHVPHLSIPRGQMIWLRDFLCSENVAYTVDDRRSAGIPLNASWKGVMEPHDYQIEGCRLISKYEQGVFSWWPGAGKTVFGLYAIAEYLKRSTLILVNSNELANQWSSRIRKFLHYPHDIGRIQQSTIDIQPITICLVQSLMRWEPAKIAALNKHFGVLIHDEAHHTSAEGNRTAIDPLSQKYRIALTANETRKDQCEFLVYDYYDKIRQRVRGNVLTPTITQINTGVRIPWNQRTRWDSVEKKLSANPGRTQFILDNIIKDVHAGHKVLTISSRTEVATKLEELLNQKGIPSMCLIGGSDFDIDKVEQKVRSNQIKVITSCKLFQEGIDVPPLSKLHNTSHSTNHEMMRQFIGRVCRVDKPDKLPPEVTEYIDDIIPCKVGAKKRLDYYKELGFNINQGYYSRFNSLY